MDVALDLFIKLVLLLVLVGLTCLAASWALLRGLKPRVVVLAGAVTLALFFIGLFFLMQSSLDQGLVPTFQKYFDKAWNHQTQWLSGQGASADRIGMFKEVYEKYVVQSFPAWVALNCLVMGLLAYYLSSAILLRVTPKVSKAVAFREWIVPEPLVFGLIAGAILKLVFRENSLMDIVGNNLLVFFVGLYTLGGLSIISFFFHKWRLPSALRILSYLVLLNLIFETICCFGVLDVWFDFRKIKTAAPQSTATT